MEFKLETRSTTAKSKTKRNVRAVRYSKTKSIDISITAKRGTPRSARLSLKEAKALGEALILMADADDETCVRFTNKEIK